MPNIASAKKRTRTTAKRTAINTARKTRVRGFIRKVEEAIASGDTKAALAALKAAEPEIMRGELIAIDLETTGLDQETDDIIEVGAVRLIDGQVVDEYSTLVNPGRPIPEAITLLTGITDDDFRPKPHKPGEHPIPPAPGIRPSFASGSPNCAPSPQTMISPDIASSSYATKNVCGLSPISRTSC